MNLGLKEEEYTSVRDTLLPADVSTILLYKWHWIFWQGSEITGNYTQNEMSWLFLAMWIENCFFSLKRALASSAPGYELVPGQQWEFWGRPGKVTLGWRMCWEMAGTRWFLVLEGAWRAWNLGFTLLGQGEFKIASSSWTLWKCLLYVKTIDYQQFYMLYHHMPPCCI